MNLDQVTKIKELDKSNSLASIEQLYLQCEQAWRDVKKVKIDKSYKKVNKIVVNGMGGSTLGTHLIDSLFFNELKIPLRIVRGYDLPGIVDKNTLYVASSYSGGTEEVMFGLKEAIKRKAKIMGITAGGKLEKILKKKGLPYYKIKADFNPSGQPRMALGYSVVGQLGLFKKLGFLKIGDIQIENLVQKLKKLNNLWGVERILKNNLAKKLAKSFDKKIINLVSAEHLFANTHILANQLNETSKNFANYFALPELNHHLLEGLSYPLSNKKNLIFFFIQSDNFFKKITKRFRITQEVVKKNGLDYRVYKTKSKTKLEEAFEVLLLGSYISFYLAMLHDVDPSLIPWVDYFKKKLK